MTEDARPDVPGPMSHMPDGGNWEGGCTDTQGRKWLHRANVGWERRPDRSPWFAANPKPRQWWQRLWRRR